MKDDLEKEYGENDEQDMQENENKNDNKNNNINNYINILFAKYLSQGNNFDYII